MLTSRSEIGAVIDTYLEALRRQGIDVERVYLFGSYLRGTADEWSDVDIVVVSPAFEGRPPWERAEITGLARHATFNAAGESVSALAKTPEELARSHPASFLADVLQDAALLYER